MVSYVLTLPEIRHYPKRKDLSRHLREKIARLFAIAWEKNLKFGTLSELSKTVGLSISSIILLKHADTTHERVTGEKLIALFAALGCQIQYCDKNGHPETNLSRSLEELRENGAFISFPFLKRS